MEAWPGLDRSDPDVWELRAALPPHGRIVTMIVGAGLTLFGGVFFTAGMTVEVQGGGRYGNAMFCAVGALTGCLGLAVMAVGAIRRRVWIDRRLGEIAFERRLGPVGSVRRWPTAEVAGVELVWSDGRDRWHAKGNPIPYWWARLLGPRPPISLQRMTHFDTTAAATRAGQALADFLRVPLKQGREGLDIDAEDEELAREAAQGGDPDSRPDAR
jgi:hypothetical protein